MVKHICPRCGYCSDEIENIKRHPQKQENYSLTDKARSELYTQKFVLFNGRKFYNKGYRMVRNFIEEFADNISCYEEIRLYEEKERKEIENRVCAIMYNYLD